MKIPVAIVGGGPGGQSMGMFLAKEGIPSVVVEKDKFPRYHIGESMTGECGGIVRALGMEQDMADAKHPFKQGVKVWGPKGTSDWFVPVAARGPTRELVPMGTWQVRRSVFDQQIARRASDMKVEMIHGEALDCIRGDDGSVKGLRVAMADGGIQEIHSEVVVDATGQYTFLSRKGVASERIPGFYDRQIAVFSQVAGTIRDDGNTTDRRETHPDNTLIFYKKRHHWAWFIPLDDDAVSVGIVAPGAYFADKRESKADYIVRELGELNPELARRVPDRRLIEEARAIPNYSFQLKTFCGKGWACIGDSHRFVDPIFSFGVYVSMKEAQMLAPAIRRYLEGEGRDLENPFIEHQKKCDGGLDNIADLMDAFWEKPIGFAFLVHGERHRADLIDLFAGRIYMNEPSPGLLELRALAEKGRREMPTDDATYGPAKFV